VLPTWRPAAITSRNRSSDRRTATTSSKFEGSLADADLQDSLSN